jgi:hypothetical protein
MSNQYKSATRLADCKTLSYLSYKGKANFSIIERGDDVLTVQQCQTCDESSTRAAKPGVVWPWPHTIDVAKKRWKKLAVGKQAE